MRQPFDSQSGMSLVETIIATSVLTVGAVGLATVFLYGMQATMSSPYELTATQKVRRSAIAQQFADDIEDMYAGASA